MTVKYKTRDFNCNGSMFIELSVTACYVSSNYRTDLTLHQDLFQESGDVCREVWRLVFVQ